MKKRNLILLLAFLSITGCATWKKTLASSGGTNAAIHNAIEDFARTSKLFKDDDVFHVNIYDNDPLSTYRFDNENLILVSILGDRDKKIDVKAEHRIGSYSNFFPTDYIIKNGKFFYWNNPEKPITQEFIDIFSRYILIDSINMYGLVEIRGYSIDDSQKGVDYYFCKDDFTNYKKNTGRIAAGSYEPPKLKCKSKK